MFSMMVVPLFLLALASPEIPDLGEVSPVPLRVPQEYPTIQEAVDDAHSGDIVLVFPGTYVENIDFFGKEIILVSARGPAVTWIDGNQSGPAVMCQSGETNDAVIEGFTITNGYWVDGGGIACYTSSPTITNNIIFGNLAYYHGGGVGCMIGSAPIISKNIIHSNMAGVDQVGWGGGIGSNSSSPSIKHNIVYNNSTLIGGGGIFCKLSPPGSPPIDHNKIVYNNSGARGGGIFFSYSDFTIMNNIINHNQSSYGGGMHFAHSGVSIAKNNLICNNTATNRGGGIHCNDASPIFILNTLCENSAVEFGGGICSELTGSVNVSNSILWNNQAPKGPEIYVGILEFPSIFSISYSNVTNGLEGAAYASDIMFNWHRPTMIQDDPLFVVGPEGAYYLSQITAGQAADSPCLDFGSAFASALGMSKCWTSTLGDPDIRTVDIGFHYGMSTIGPFENHHE